MGTISPSWTQAWNDNSSTLIIDFDIIHNNTNRTFRKRWWWTKSIQYNLQVATFTEIGAPGRHSWYLPTGTTFAFSLNCFNYNTGAMSDRANYGNLLNNTTTWDEPEEPWFTFPGPPGAPAPSAPGVYTQSYGRNRFQVQAANSNGTNHEVFTWDSVSAWVLRGAGGPGGTGWCNYDMPAGVLSATVLARACNVNAAGARSTDSDVSTTIYSQNVVPTAPTNLAITPNKSLITVPVTFTWTHNDSLGTHQATPDPQTNYQLAYQKIAGPGAGGALVEQGVVASGTSSATLTMPSPGKYEVKVRTWDWEGASGPYSSVATFEVTREAVYIGGAWKAAPTMVRVGGAWLPHVPIKL